MFCVLIEFHPMLGLDPHNELVPAAPAPTPAPMEPHIVAATMNWVIPAKTADKVLALYGRVMQRGTDIQTLIPHVPTGPGVLLAPLLFLSSGSKSHFGPSSVEANSAPVAAALQLLCNPNLNCGTVAGLGMVLAPNTVVTGMTAGDIIGGLFALTTDLAIQWAMNAIVGHVFPDSVGGNVAGSLAEIFLGSPVGFSANSNGSGPVGVVGRLVGDVSGMARALGERLGAVFESAAGDDRDADKDRAAADEKTESKPVDGWNLLGDDPASPGDLILLKKAALSAPLPLRPFTNGALDNPLAETF